MHIKISKFLLLWFRRRSVPEPDFIATGSCPSLTEYFAKDNAPTQSCSGHYVAPEPSNDDPSVEDPDNSDDPNNSANGDDPSGTNGDNSGTVPTPSEPDVQPAP